MTPSTTGSRDHRARPSHRPPPPDGGGYWILDAGAGLPLRDAAPSSVAAGHGGGLDPAAAIFTTSDGGGYWISTALGKV